MIEHENKIIQVALMKLGYDVGPIDGIIGPRTRKAIVTYKMACGKTPNANLDPLTKHNLLARALISTNGPPLWLYGAESFIGTKEIRGKKHNSKIVQFFKSIGTRIRNDETPWCAAFVGHVLELCGLSSTKSAGARSYNKWGFEIKEPAVGAVVVFWRGSRLGWSGHVGFIVGKDSENNLLVLGGNQANAVNIRAFKTSRVLSYRWPKISILPETGFDKLPVINEEYLLSVNES